MFHTNIMNKTQFSFPRLVYLCIFTINVKHNEIQIYYLEVNKFVLFSTATDNPGKVYT